MVWHIIPANILFIVNVIFTDGIRVFLIARIFPRPCGARKNTTQLAKYPHVLYAKPWIRCMCILYTYTYTYCWLKNALTMTYKNCFNHAISHLVHQRNSWEDFIYVPVVSRLHVVMYFGNFLMLTLAVDPFAKGLSWGFREFIFHRELKAGL